MRSAASPDFEVPSAEDVAAEQRNYFADGTVSIGEYGEAFARFEVCAAETGAPLAQVDRDPVTGLISYASSGELIASGSVDRGGHSSDVTSPLNTCYQRYFDLTEITFQLTDPTVLAARPEQQLQLFRQTMEPCLQANDVTIPPHLQYDTPEYLDLTARFGELATSGACTGPSPPIAPEP